MFDPISSPRVFGLNLGVDYPKSVVDGVISRTNDAPPDQLARAIIYVNTRRMARRMSELFTQRGTRLLPRIKLITDLAEDPTLTAGLPTADPLARRLELAQLVRALIDREDGIAPRAAAFDLADSLASLMDEMQGEGISPEKLQNLDVAHHSEYWARSLKFINLVREFFSDGDAEARQRHAVKTLINKWHEAPPQTPIIVAGSTGSRATTRLLMTAVANQPQGAIILPGFDHLMRSETWDNLSERETSEDHPQYRFKVLADELDIHRSDVVDWGHGEVANPARNALLSLAMRPAPVTHAWLDEGPLLKDVDIAMRDVTLIEAPSPRIEALSIAIGMREAVDRGKSVALITPDRVLTRQVTAALQRWGINPDDSAGLPLALSAPGRLLRQTANLLGNRVTSQDLLALLKHPLVGSPNRGIHLLNTRDLELEFLRGGTPFPTRENLLEWLSNRDTRQDELSPWIRWVADFIEVLEEMKAASLSELLAQHISLTKQIVAGPDNEDASALWEKDAGDAARAEVSKLTNAAASGGTLTPREYHDLFSAVIAKGEVRNATTPNTDVMIWGTLEARVQGADLMILAGLNDGIWPSTPTPDPWLNRQMRHDAGLLLPEREIGLAALDFQQSATAPEVWLTRSTRNSEAETVPSRWINRLRNLLHGLPQNGAEIYAEAKARGDIYLAHAAALEAVSIPVPPAARPSPQPPLEARPQKLSVTRIEKLIRDPYAIYARYILDLQPLRDLVSSPDAPMRGLAIHEVLERFIKETAENLGSAPLDHLMGIANDVFETRVPWPATREMWRAKLKRSAAWFIETEHDRRTHSAPLMINGIPALETKAAAAMASPKFTLEGRIDRVDQQDDGRLVLYDYKTGGLPTDAQQKHFNKQLPLLAALVLRNGLSGQSGYQVARTGYIGLGSDTRELAHEYADDQLEEVWENFAELIAEYDDIEKGYTARRAVFESRYEQDYDHLSRFGEWDQTDPATPEKVGM